MGALSGTWTRRRALSEFFDHAGLRVAHAVDGDHAVLKATAKPPDVIVMDLAMPVLDGWTATRELEKRAKTKPIPIIVLTGHATEDNLRRAKDAGADAMLNELRDGSVRLPARAHGVILR